MKSQRGQILPLLAVSLAVLMGFAGIAIDVGYLEYWQQKQQTATDAAALGGAQNLAESNCSNAANAGLAALNDASANGFPTGQVSPVTPPSSGPYAANACAISVQIATTNLAAFFSRLFGFPAGVSELNECHGGRRNRRQRILHVPVEPHHTHGLQRRDGELTGLRNRFKFQRKL